MTETSEELLDLFINHQEITELDLSNNNLTKLPLGISFLTSLKKLDIRNNIFSDVINFLIYKFIFLVRRCCKNINNNKIFNNSRY